MNSIFRSRSYPADFLLENLKNQIHVVQTAQRSGVRRSRLQPLFQGVEIGVGFGRR